MHHTYQALEHCVVLSQRGKVFRSTTTDIHMWLQFQQLEDFGINRGAALSVIC